MSTDPDPYPSPHDGADTDILGREAPPVYPDEHTWFVECQQDDGSWKSVHPPEPREAALNRLEVKRFVKPLNEWRLVRATRTYTVESA